MAFDVLTEVLRLVRSYCKMSDDDKSEIIGT